MASTSILLFASSLAGKYSNYDQAQESPKDFAHINIYFRPLIWSILNGPWFYSEQSYDYAPWSPYRQGLHKLSKAENIFILENYALEAPERMAGSGFMPELLSPLKKESLVKRCGCSMHFQETTHGRYIGKVEAGQRCLIKKDGNITYLASNVELSDDEFKTLDEGFDIRTNRKIWGSTNGPLKFKKVETLDQQLIGEWLQLDQ